LQGLIIYDNTVFYFDIALTFHYLFIRQEAARQWKNKKTTLFYFVIALTFHYLFIRQEAARQWKNKKNDAFLFCHCTHLSLSLYKISGTREIESKLSFRSFALSLPHNKPIP